MAINLTKVMNMMMELITPKKIVSTLLISSFLYCLPSLAGEKINKTLPINDVNRISIENHRGMVKVIGSDTDQVTVSGELDDEAEEFIFKQKGNKILISVEMPARYKNKGSNKGSNLTISVPNTSRISFDGISSNFSIEEIDAGLDVKTVSGNVTAKNISNHIEINTVSGNVSTKALSGKVQLQSVSGDIKDIASSGRLYLKAVSGDIDSKSSASEVSIESVSGDVEMELSETDDIQMSTVSGDVDIELALNRDGVMRMSSVSGNYDVKFTKDIDAQFKLKTSVGGDIINKITGDKAKKGKYMPSAKLYFETGSGSASVRASTVSGSIKVSQ